MCKILCLSSHDPAKRDEIIVKVWQQMAISEKDGYGAAWFSPDGQIGYHKRRYPTLRSGDPLPFVRPTKSPEDFGVSVDIPSDGGFLIIHARTATNPINLANTHPFIDVLEDGRRVALIHNGVVKSDKYSNILQGCTCDSELLLRAYVDGGMDHVEKYIDGRFAFAYLELVPPTEEEVRLAAERGEGVPVGKKTMHVAKERAANLHVGTTPDGTIVFTTSEYTLREVGAVHDGEFLDNHLVILSDKTNFEMSTFKSLTLFEKKTARWFNPDPPKSAPVHPPAQQEQKHQHYPPKTVSTDSDIDKALAEIEEQEIRALEQEAIEIYPG